VRPGGTIVYVTCSVLDEENGAPIRDFLAENAGFSLIPPSDIAGPLGERAYLFRRAALLSAEGLLMTPRRTDTDGFFVAMLRKSERAA
jgi:16S rRNA (cytosine967-C5)-methyltransferase